ncbi:MAG TPA: sialidase family protein [Polyangia bacterium]|nr:sialidase family protein [Polyangia bacterium]
MTAARPRGRRATPVLVATLALGLWPAPRPVHANGAFPDSLGILLPADRPSEILLSTNFGIISSEDGGKTWAWSCEQVSSNLAQFYQLGPPPTDRMFAVSSSGLIFSDDGSCGWSVAGGTAKTSLVTDYFPDPRDSMHVLAIALPNTTNLEAEGIYASNDGGATFGEPAYKAPIMGGLTGIEIARSDPHVVYAAMYESPGIHPRIIHSGDGGLTWDPPIDIEQYIGPSSYRIIAVDPDDPQKVYLRVQEPLRESLAISDDGGQTFAEPVHFPVQMTAFARLAGGTILVAGTQADNQGTVMPLGYRSTDGGKTFSSWATPTLRGLAERNGKLYAAADNTKDPFALGVSTDEGMTFTRLMKFSDVAGIKSCVQASCAKSCTTLAMQQLWSASICSPPPVMQPTLKTGGCAIPRGPASGALGLALLIVAVASRAGVRARR